MNADRSYMQGHTEKQSKREATYTQMYFYLTIYIFFSFTIIYYLLYFIYISVIC